MSDLEPFIWFSLTQPHGNSGAKKFLYERVSYEGDVEVHRKIETVWTYSHAAFQDLLKRWNKQGAPAGRVFNRNHTYKEISVS